MCRKLHWNLRGHYQYRIRFCVIWTVFIGRANASSIYFSLHYVIQLYFAADFKAMRWFDSALRIYLCPSQADIHWFYVKGRLTKHKFKKKTVEKYVHENCFWLLARPARPFQCHNVTSSLRWTISTLPPCVFFFFECAIWGKLAQRNRSNLISSL